MNLKQKLSGTNKPWPKVYVILHNDIQKSLLATYSLTYDSGMTIEQLKYTTIATAKQ